MFWVLLCVSGCAGFLEFPGVVVGLLQGVF